MNKECTYCSIWGVSYGLVLARGPCPVGGLSKILRFAHLGDTAISMGDVGGSMDHKSRVPAKEGLHFFHYFLGKGCWKAAESELTSTMRVVPCQGCVSRASSAMSGMHIGFLIKIRFTFSRFAAGSELEHCLSWVGECSHRVVPVHASP